MKRLIFVRHGRAEESHPQFTDLERSLTAKGKIVSEQMAVKLKEKKIVPGVYISSPAFRALETALIFARAYEFDPEKIMVRRNLYFNVNLKTLAEILAEVSDDYDSVILFGHNPSFTEIPDRLCSSGCDFMPKSAIVSLLFKADTWAGVMKEKGKQEIYLRPDKST
ncbi:MAG: histidine phosphatase family protein [Bacteroidales bacterium]